jgi:hypothetical protein
MRVVVIRMPSQATCRYRPCAPFVLHNLAEPATSLRSTPVPRPLDRVVRFLVDRPGVSAALIISAGMFAMLIPYVGPVLGLVILGGGLGGIALLRESARRELEAPEPRPALPPATPRSPGQLERGSRSAASPPPPRALSESVQPIAHLTQVGRNPARSHSQQLRKVVAIAQQMPLDPRPKVLDEQIEVGGETHYVR